MTHGLFVNHKNLGEVLSVAGLAILAECLESPLSQLKFTRTNTVVGDDGVFRSRKFTFEHPDYSTLLDRIAGLEMTLGEGGEIVLCEHGKDGILTIDWVYLPVFLGNSGGFKGADKVEFVAFHLAAFKELSTTSSDLLTLSMDTNKPNYLSRISQLEKNYIDAGGVYKEGNRVFAKELLILVALQNLHLMMSTLVKEGRLEYSIPTEATTLNGLFLSAVEVEPEKP